MKRCPAPWAGATGFSCCFIIRTSGCFSLLAAKLPAHLIDTLILAIVPFNMVYTSWAVATALPRSGCQRCRKWIHLRKKLFPFTSSCHPLGQKPMQETPHKPDTSGPGRLLPSVDAELRPRCTAAPRLGAGLPALGFRRASSGPPPLPTAHLSHLPDHSLYSGVRA